MKFNLKSFIMKTVKTFLVVILCLSTINLMAQSNSSRRAGKGAGDGAIIGAVAGALFGGGDFVGDALGGALIGSGVGALSGAIKGGKEDRNQKEQYQALIRQYGEDNIRGYAALLNQDHERAIALFQVAQTSSNNQHRIIALYLRACAEKDRKNKPAMDDLLQKIADQDSDVDDREMALVAVNQILLEIRRDRRMS